MSYLIRFVGGPFDGSELTAAAAPERIVRSTERAPEGLAADKDRDSDILVRAHEYKLDRIETLDEPPGARESECHLGSDRVAEYRYIGPDRGRHSLKT